MATKHPRIGIIRDPELERALARTRPLLGEREKRSQAAHVRTLALRGAEALVAEGGSAAELRRRLAEEHGARPATRDPGTVEIPPGDVDPDDPTPASDALRWVRE